MDSLRSQHHLRHTIVFLLLLFGVSSLPAVQATVLQLNGGTAYLDSTNTTVQITGTVNLHPRPNTQYGTLDITLQDTNARIAHISAAIARHAQFTLPHSDQYTYRFNANTGRVEIHHAGVLMLSLPLNSQGETAHIRIGENDAFTRIQVDVNTQQLIASSLPGEQPEQPMQNFSGRVFTHTHLANAQIYIEALAVETSPAGLTENTVTAGTQICATQTDQQGQFTCSIPEAVTDVRVIAQWDEDELQGLYSTRNQHIPPNITPYSTILTIYADGISANTPTELLHRALSDLSGVLGLHAEQFLQPVSTADSSKILNEFGQYSWFAELAAGEAFTLAALRRQQLKDLFPTGTHYQEYVPVADQSPQASGTRLVSMTGQDVTNSIENIPQIIQAIRVDEQNHNNIHAMAANVTPLRGQINAQSSAVSAVMLGLSINLGTLGQHERDQFYQQMLNMPAFRALSTTIQEDMDAGTPFTRNPTATRLAAQIVADLARQTMQENATSLIRSSASIRSHTSVREARNMLRMASERAGQYRCATPNYEDNYLKFECKSEVTNNNNFKFDVRNKTWIGYSIVEEDKQNQFFAGKFITPNRLDSAIKDFTTWNNRPASGDFDGSFPSTGGNTVDYIAFNTFGLNQPTLFNILLTLEDLLGSSAQLTRYTTEVSRVATELQDNIEMMRNGLESFAKAIQAFSEIGLLIVHALDENPADSFERKVLKDIEHYISQFIDVNNKIFLLLEAFIEGDDPLEGITLDKLDSRNENLALREIIHSRNIIQFAEYVKKIKDSGIERSFVRDFILAIFPPIYVNENGKHVHLITIIYKLQDGQTLSTEEKRALTKFIVYLFQGKGKEVIRYPQDYVQVGTGENAFLADALYLLDTSVTLIKFINSVTDGSRVISLKNTIDGAKKFAVEVGKEVAQQIGETYANAAIQFATYQYASQLAKVVPFVRGANVARAVGETAAMAYHWGTLPNELPYQVNNANGNVGIYSSVLTSSKFDSHIFISSQPNIFHMSFLDADNISYPRLPSQVIASGEISFRPATARIVVNPGFKTYLTQNNFLPRSVLLNSSIQINGQLAYQLLVRSGDRSAPMPGCVLNSVLTNAVENTEQLIFSEMINKCASNNAMTLNLYGAHAKSSTQASQHFIQLKNPGYYRVRHYVTMLPDEKMAESTARDSFFYAWEHNYDVHIMPKWDLPAPQASFLAHPMETEFTSSIPLMLRNLPQNQTLTMIPVIRGAVQLPIRIHGKPEQPVLVPITNHNKGAEHAVYMVKGSLYAPMWSDQLDFSSQELLDSLVTAGVAIKIPLQDLNERPFSNLTATAYDRSIYLRWDHINDLTYDLYLAPAELCLLPHSEDCETHQSAKKLKNASYIFSGLDSETNYRITVHARGMRGELFFTHTWEISTLDEPPPSIEITAVSPLTAALNQPTVFTVTGTNLPATLAMAITDAECNKNPGGTAQRHTFSCTPRQAGSQTYTIKDQPGGITLQEGAVLINAATVTSRLNDTGIDWWADNSSNNLKSPVESHPGQDADFGRDALARQGQLQKIGAGAAGFDYTKLDANGRPLAIQNMPWSDGGNETDGTRWSCVQDNVTGLIWEVKVNDRNHLRHHGHTYTWYNPDPNTNGGRAGTQNRGLCVGSDCDTLGYVQAINAQGLCGANDWRMPTRVELESLVHAGRHSPAIDISHFPHTPSNWFWSSSPYAGSSVHAWLVGFSNGRVGGFKDHTCRVRLVRARQ
ncbi:DUF1566 domain-containing protein [Thiorhodospira sibirica]|uniref:Lcl C-terminal domain-containing protein n=1 Tax=Thiorhodospira sibirica TaxID=154347 RepID=UPI00022C1CDE|nr:DUF1566 domain-containing protein [Thiorhodospira sibirica]